MDLKPVFPFEPISSAKIPKGKEWIYETKWDGTRILTYFDGDEVSLFNRKKNERSYHYPELTDIHSYCNANSIILDGEVIALGENGRPSFREVMKRDSIRQLEKVKYIKEITPIFYCIFDILYLNGKWLHELPLSDRKKLLNETIQPTGHVQLTPIKNEGEILFQVMKEQGMEGIVAKNIHSKYKFHAKEASWRKIKNFQDIIAVVGGVTFRNSVVNALLLGLYDERGMLHYIGHAGTGKLTDDDWQTITSYIDQLVTEKRPFVKKPAVQGKSKPTWLEPVLTVKIQYIEWQQGHSIRQPSIQAFVNIPPEKCKFPNEEE